VTCIWLLARKNSDGPSKAVVPILTIIVAVLL